MTQIEQLDVPAPGVESAIEGKLRQAWRKERRFVHLRGMSILVLWAAALVAVDFLLDFMLEMPGWARLALLAVNIGSLVWAVKHYWLKGLRGYDPVRVSLEVERLHPDLKSLLVSFVQLRHGGGNADASPALIAALRRQAVEVTRPLNFRRIVSYKDIRRLLVVCVCVVVFFCGISINWPAHLKALFLRLVNPNSTVAYPTRTNIREVYAQVVTGAAADDAANIATAGGNGQGGSGESWARCPCHGDASVRGGQSLQINVLWGGMTPSEEKRKLFRKGSGGAWEPGIPLKQGKDGRFLYRFDGLYDAFDYYVKLGDATSGTYSVRVAPTPHIRKMKVRVAYPRYTCIGPRDFEDLNVDAPQGSVLQWQLDFDMPLAQAQWIKGEVGSAVDAMPQSAPGANALPPTTRQWHQATKPTATTMSSGQLADNQAVLMNLSADGKSATVMVAADESLAYHFNWTDKEHGFEYADDITYRVGVTPDNPPEVELLKPSGDVRATIKKKLDIAFKATDDYGLVNGWFVYRINDGEEKKLPLEKLSGPSADKPALVAERQATWPVKEKIPELNEGDTLTFAIEVSDNYPGKDGPNLSRSRQCRMTIVSQAEYLQWVLEEEKRLVTEINGMQSEEKAASEQVDKIQQPSSAPTTAPGK
jgi:hypothetical protein